LRWRGQGIRQFVLSPEDDAQNWSVLIPQLGDSAIVPVYQHPPLMISATRPAAGDHLTDRSRRSFRVEQNRRQFVLVGETPFSLVEYLDEIKELGARRFRIDLCYGIDTPEQAADIIRKTTTGQPVPGHPGHFMRNVRF
jgi:hypothetical protein